MMKICRFISLFLILLVITGCSKIEKVSPELKEKLDSEEFQKERKGLKEVWGIDADVDYDSVETVMNSFCNALKQGNAEDALKYLVPDPGRIDHYRGFFEAIGEEGVKDYGERLSKTTLTGKTEKNALFEGKTNLEGHVLEINVDFRFTVFGWKIDGVY